MQAPLPLVLIGRVKDIKDPDKMGRVQVEIDAYTGKVTLPWLRILQSSASTASGTFFLPETGDEVVILRGDGPNPDGMIVLGCVYGGTDRLPQKRKKPAAGKAPTGNEDMAEDGENNFKQIISRAGHEILLDDTSDKGQIRISTGDGKMALTLDTVGKKLTVFATDELDILAKTINIKADTAVNIETMDLAVKTNAAIKMKATSDFAAEGVNATLKGTAAATVDGGTTAIKGKSIKLGM